MQGAAGVGKSELAWFRDVVQSAVDYGVISMDLEARITAWNPGAVRLFRYEEAEVCGQFAHLIFTPEDIRSGVPEKERMGAIEKGSTADERWHLRKDNTVFWASGRMILVRDSRHQPAGLVKIVQDRTTEKAVHDALRQTQERYQLVSLATNDVIWDWDLRTNELAWNEAITTHFGFTPEEFGSAFQAWEDRVHPNDRERVMAGIRKAIASGAESWSDRYQFRRKDGEYATFFDRGRIARDASGVPIRMIGSMLNITNDRRAENVLRDAQARIEQQNAELEASVARRTEELSAALHDLEEFSYSMSHDLKGPATTMRALVDILQNERLTAEESADLIVRIRRNAIALCDLIDEMLGFSAIGLTPPKFEVVDLDPFLSRVTADARKVMNTPAAIIEMRTPLGRVHADRTLLWHATHNVVTNALKFVAAGVPPRVTIWTERRNNRVQLRIQDNGIGIDPRFRDQVFELCRRLHLTRVYPGHGVGLATVKRAMEKMGGVVTFESVPAAGTTFTLELPIGG